MRNYFDISNFEEELLTSGTAERDRSFLNGYKSLMMRHQHIVLMEQPFARDLIIRRHILKVVLLAVLLIVISKIISSMILIPFSVLVLISMAYTSVLFFRANNGLRNYMEKLMSIENAREKYTREFKKLMASMSQKKTDKLKSKNGSTRLLNSIAHRRVKRFKSLK